MIRVVVYCTKFLVAIIAALLLSSCNPILNGVDGNGNVTTEVRNIAGKFTAVQASAGIEVEMKQDSTAKVEVEADSNLLEFVKTELEGETLKVYIDKSISGAKELKVYIHMPELKKVTSNSGANVLLMGTFVGTNLVMDSSSGAHLEGKVEYDTVDAETSSGSSMDIKGIALKLKTSSSSGSTLNAKGLLANDVNADASSGSESSVNARVTLEANASSGASIKYTGIAKSVDKNESSGGSIRKID